jgi:hypothetical protein
MTREEFYKKQQSGEITRERCSPEEKTVDPQDIIPDKDWNSDSKDFWSHHGLSKEEYMDYVKSGQADSAKPVAVSKCGDKYVLDDFGNHRVAASQELNRPIKVNIVGEYKEQSQSQDKEEEMSM